MGNAIFQINQPFCFQQNPVFQPNAFQSPVANICYQPSNNAAAGFFSFLGLFFGR